MAGPPVPGHSSVGRPVQLRVQLAQQFLDGLDQQIEPAVQAVPATMLGPDRVCTFKSGLSEVKVILAPPAPDSATANAYWDAERAQAPADLPITDLTLFDRSAYGNGTTVGAPVSALFVIKGQYFFDLYCGFPACTQAASITAAQLIGGRLP